MDGWIDRCVSLFLQPNKQVLLFHKTIEHYYYRYYYDSQKGERTIRAAVVKSTTTHKTRDRRSAWTDAVFLWY